ncbi:hypothetical protein AAE478_000341 [Parahypoxylon ruwenzoriense]
MPASSQLLSTLRSRLYPIPPESPSPPHSYPPIASIPQTSPERLALSSTGVPEDNTSSTVLYLAYGSNLSAETFLGVRGIRPISRANVSAPSLDLAFDLPGLPYWEPCFANATARKLPKPPLPIPGNPPGNPPLPLLLLTAFISPTPIPSMILSLRPAKKPARNNKTEGLPPTALLPSLPPRGPTWSKGLYGVVYEVTREDYATIIRTEGGGTAYRDVQVPCLALPPSLHIPEKPPLPELPKPFLAHTLFAPHLPQLPPDNDHGDNDDDDDDKHGWLAKLLLPTRRLDPDYAQPSARYLKLIRDGARENCLPDDYQAYLTRLQPYTITTWRQEVGHWLLLLAALPFFLFILGLSSLLADKDGAVPRWLAVSSTVSINLMWMAYDGFFKPWFGDGERTIEEDDRDSDASIGRDTGRRDPSMIRNEHVWGSEKSLLLADW